jgi:aspartate/methionine/tyrosine aminotransferase
MLNDLRPEAHVSESGIVEVMRYGRGREGLIPLWVGESDLPTPSFICEAATRSLAAGETFYTWQRGIPELREALARYHETLLGRPFSPERFFVTGSGMQAVQIAMRMVAGNGDDVIVPTPAWPNTAAVVHVAGGRAVEVAMELQGHCWMLDLARLEAAITPKTRAFAINTPSNPTGWTATREELAAVLALARKHGLWIVADEIYGRFVYDGSPRAPSFHDVMEEDDKIIFVQTFSKNWAMTGWRIGWVEAHPSLGPAIENLVQYSTSGVPVFAQRAAIVAIEQGEAFVQHQIERCRHNRAILQQAFDGSNMIVNPQPQGAFYTFLGFSGMQDSRRLAMDLIDEVNVGLAPGGTFGAAGEGYLRLCYARRSDHIEMAASKLRAWAEQRLAG